VPTSIRRKLFDILEMLRPGGDMQKNVITKQVNSMLSHIQKIMLSSNGRKKIDVSPASAD